MWILIGDQKLLENFSFEYDDYNKRYIRNDDFEYGGDIFINDAENFFRAEASCVELPDDAYYTPAHILMYDEAYRLRGLVDAGLVRWVDSQPE